MSIVKLDREKIEFLATEAGKFVFKKEAEASLVELLDAIDFLQATLENVKEKIGEAGLTISPDFKGVVGSALNVTFTSTGDRYKSDNNLFNKLISYTRADSGKIDDYKQKEGQLPDGVIENIRVKKISISRRKNEITA